MAHREGWSLHQYLDDWLLRHQSKESLSQHQDRLLELCLNLGLLVNWKKSELISLQVFVFVGYRYVTQLGVVLPPDDRLKKIRTMASWFWRDRVLPAYLWLSLLGLMSSSEKLIPMGRLHMRQLQLDLRSQWHQASDAEDHLVTLSPLSVKDLEWWLDPLNLTRGSPFREPPPSIHLFKDASKEGWGAHWDFHMVSGIWQGPFQLWHINVQELQAAFLALQHWQDQFVGQVVLLATDNSTVVSYVNKQGGTKSPTLLLFARELLLWCHSQQISLRAQHIPGKLNVLAYSLSRVG